MLESRMELYEEDPTIHLLQLSYI